MGNVINTLRKYKSTVNSQSGFSLIEMFIVLLVIAIIVVLALPQFMSSRRLLKFSGVQRLMVTSLREARQDSMTQRTTITVKYDDTNKQMTVSGGTFGVPGAANNKVISLSGDGVTQSEIVYGRPPGATAAALGDGTNLTALTSGVTEIKFRADGSVVDPSNNPQSKALFLYDSVDADATGFAVSVLGVGGRVKVWRYNRTINAYVE
jgi:prepilin-type N-terminal cleavage/methylation domain-containing protein